VIINSIDLMNQQTVQLRQGREKVLDAGDPRPILERFNMLGEVAVIDLDAAMGRGSNADIVRDLLPLGRCRIGGGIRTAESARRWLDAGAARVILGTAATAETLSQVPRERVIAALDARDGNIVVEGWTRGTGAKVAERMRELGQYVGGFLVTFVETEGTLSGLPVERASELAELCRTLGCRLTVAGGVRTPAEVAALDAIGVDAQVGMAVYTGLIHPADALWACLRTDRADRLVPTMVCDARGTALGLAYSDAESLRAAYDEQRGIYHSRKRGLWRKGETSGTTQRLLRIDADCDRDCLRFTVDQTGEGFCHNGTWSCFGQTGGLGELERRLITTAAHAAAGTGDAASYTARLLRDATLLSAKLKEEAAELSAETSRDRVASEAADVLYFTLVKLRAHGVNLTDVERELDRRALKLQRRPGDAKP
jgi:phosphoribosyl-ATP pyrophosphohydrolase/phosphoribosyl-AMP cyclohydrolase